MAQPTRKQPKGGEPQAASTGFGGFANIVAGIALLLALIFALQLAAGVVAGSYGRWLAAGTGPAPGVPQQPNAWAQVLAAIDQGGLGSGLARAIVLVIAGGIGLTALGSANRVAMRTPALGFGWLFVLLAALLLALASIKFNRAGIDSAIEYAGYLGTSGVLVALAAGLAALARGFGAFRQFPMAFVLVLLLHLGLMAFSGFTLSGSFAGNLGLIVWLGIIMLGFAYARQLAK